MFFASGQNMLYFRPKYALNHRSKLQGTAISCGGKHGGNRDAEVSRVRLASDLGSRASTPTVECKRTHAWRLAQVRSCVGLVDP